MRIYLLLAIAGASFSLGWLNDRTAAREWRAMPKWQRWLGLYVVATVAAFAFVGGWLTAAPHRATVTATAAHVVVRGIVRVWPAG